MYGPTFAAISPDHPLAKALAEKDPNVVAFIEECHRMGTSQAEIDTAEKLGFDTGIKVTHPADASWTLPLYIANFVLMDYGTGAIIGCPAHDQRDLDFARKYDLPVLDVFVPVGSDERVGNIAFAPAKSETVQYVRWVGAPGVMTCEEAMKKSLEIFEKDGWGKREINFRLRDWGISRQRYWGCPIPIIHCPSCDIVPVPDKDLPVVLPEDVSFDKPGNALDHHPTWKHVKCPNCGADARRETDTMDTFVDLVLVLHALHGSMEHVGTHDDRRCQPNDAGRSVYRRRRARDPASAVQPLLHPRHEGHRSRQFRRAVRRHVHAGHGGARDLQETGRHLRLTGRDQHRRSAVTAKRATLIADWRRQSTIGPIEKMSKSKRNTVDPDDIIGTYGADTARWFMLSDSPPDRDVIWSEEGVKALRASCSVCGGRSTNQPRTANRRRQPGRLNSAPMRLAIRKAAHGALSKVSTEIEKLHFNVCLAHIREFSNVLGEALAKPGTPAPDVCWALHEASVILVQLFAPMMPHLAEECWGVLGQPGMISEARWPQIEPNLLVEDTMTLPVQVNGKKRGEVTVAREATNPEIEAAALALDAVKQALDGKPVKKVIVVAQRIVNVVG